jgi:hypothetical protein
MVSHEHSSPDSLPPPSEQERLILGELSDLHRFISQAESRLSDAEAVLAQGEPDSFEDEAIVKRAAANIDIIGMRERISAGNARFAAVMKVGDFLVSLQAEQDKKD